MQAPLCRQRFAAGYFAVKGYRIPPFRSVAAGYHSRGPLRDSSLTAWAAVHGLSMLITAGVEAGAGSEEQLRDLSRSTAQQLIRGLATGH